MGPDHGDGSFVWVGSHFDYSLTHITHSHTKPTKQTHAGTFRTDTLPAPGEKATTSHQLVSYGRNDESPPKSIILFSRERTSFGMERSIGTRAC